MSEESPPACRHLESAEVCRRDIEKAVRQKLEVEEQLLQIKFERRAIELEVGPGK